MKAQTGGQSRISFNVKMYHSDHPVCAASEASRLFYYWRSHPSCSRREHPVLAISYHILYDRRYSENIYWWNRPTMIAFRGCVHPLP